MDIPFLPSGHLSQQGTLRHGFPDSVPLFHVTVHGIQAAMPGADLADIIEVAVTARDGDRGPTNIYLVCRAHNIYLAEATYGQAAIELFRRSAESVESGS